MPTDEQSDRRAEEHGPRQAPWSPTVREIWRRMHDRHMTQRMLALKAGLNESYVRDLFRGKSRNPNPDALRALAGALQCDPIDLLEPPPVDQPPLFRDVEKIESRAKRNVRRVTIDIEEGPNSDMREILIRFVTTFPDALFTDFRNGVLALVARLYGVEMPNGDSGSGNGDNGSDHLGPEVELPSNIIGSLRKRQNI